MGKYLECIKKELLFEIGSQEFLNCHASSICALQDGTILAVWFAGEKEGADDVAIWSSKRTNQGWTSPVKIADDVDEAHWNPVLFQKNTGEMLLFYKVGRKIKNWYTKLRISKDQGETWSAPVELVPGDRGGRGPVRCKPIQLSDGTLLAGASTEDGIWTAYVDRSEDGGDTWVLSEPLTIDLQPRKEKTAEDVVLDVSPQSFLKRGVIQPTLWESASGKVHMLLRSTEGFVYRSDSDDYGKTWVKPYATDLSNNNSGIDVVKCRNGMLVLCANPNGINWGLRTPITLQVSMDNGKIWEEEMVLEDIPGEFSYPAIIEKDGKIFLTYTYDRRSIAYWEFVIR